MTDTISRKITFDYFRPAEVRRSKDGNVRTFERYFDVGEWLRKLSYSGKVKKSLELGDSTVYLDEIHDYMGTGNRYAFRVFKLRDTYLPSLIKEGNTATEIPLGENENIGEEMNILYDCEDHLLMVQRNRMSLGIFRLARWMSESLIDEECFVEMYPLYRSVEGDFFRSKRIKRLSFTVEMLGDEQYKGKALGKIINGLSGFGQRRAEITLSVGRERRRFLEHGVAVDAISEILTEGKAWFSSAIADICSMHDEISSVEKVDLFEDLLNDTITFKIEKKKPLDFKQARVKMYEVYISRLLEIHELLH